MDNLQVNEILNLQKQIDSFDSQFQLLSEQINENEKRYSTILNGLKQLLFLNF